MLCIPFHDKENNFLNPLANDRTSSPNWLWQKCHCIGSWKLGIWQTSVWGAPHPPGPPSPPHSLFIAVMSRASFACSNRSDEDDLPPDLAEAVGAPTAAAANPATATSQVSVPLVSPKGHKLSSPQTSEGKGQLSPGAKVWGKAPKSGRTR